MKEATGIVVSIVAGYYFVEHGDKVYLCRGRGRLRRAGASPLAGDIVRFNFDKGAETGVIEAVEPRRNQLQRPAVANVDAVVVVLASRSPQPDLYTADKLLAHLSFQGIPAVVCVNKSDLDPGGAARYAELYRKAGYPALSCSAETGQGLEQLSALLGARTVVLAGQSGVGKSKITSALAVGELAVPLQVGQLSAKIERGRQTTRQVSLLPLAGGGKIADTPGFSVFELDMDSRELHRMYPEFLRHAAGCKFSSCLHIHEPDCAVKEYVRLGEIAPGRYNNYLRIYQELREREAQRY